MCHGCVYAIPVSLPTKSTQACTPCAVFFKIKLSKADSITYTLLSLESILSPSPGLES